MPKTDYAGFEQATAMSVNYALDSVEKSLLEEFAKRPVASWEIVCSVLQAIDQQRRLTRPSVPQNLQ